MSTRYAAWEWRAALAASLAIVALASLPYLIAASTPAPGYRFNGLLFNPYDGNSYLAKIEIGRRGGVLFQLPYTAEPGAGAPIFLFYIGLGHLARWTGAPSILVFHLARAGAGLALLLALYAFTARFFERPGARWLAWGLIALGSGMGWLAAAAGAQTSDLWVAEAIVFLSLFANPHFPLALALMLGLFLLLVPGLAERSMRGDWRAPAAVLLLTTALAHAQPFSLAILYAVIPAACAAQWLWAGIRPPLPRLALFALAGLPWLAFDYWLTQTHPALRAWSAQNVTPSPPLWDYLVTFSPALFFAAFGAREAARRRGPLDLFLLAWVGVGFALLYAPLDLQRRLAHGLSAPIGLLAVMGLREALAPRPGLRRLALVGALCALALPANLLVAAASLQGVSLRHRLLYLRESEAAALDWIEAHAPARALTLASPDLGLFIPARTLRRVLYGHPFETINAEREEQAVRDYYAGRLGPEFLRERGVDYVVYGPREAALGPRPGAEGLTEVFAQDELILFQVER